MRTSYLVISLLLVACSSVQAPPAGPVHANGGVLPESSAELIALADQIYMSSRKLTQLKRAIASLQKAVKLKPGNYKLMWRYARILSVMARYDKTRGEKWATQGKVAAAKAIKLNPKGGEGHIYHSICAGILGKYRLSEAEDLSKEALKSAVQAGNIDPAYSDGLAARIQGAIYLYAPAWPGGVGDLDEAFELLTKLGQEHPAPENFYYLAEAHRKTEQNRQAARLYRRVLKFKARGLWRVEGPLFRRRCRQHLKQLAR